MASIGSGERYDGGHALSARDGGGDLRLVALGGRFAANPAGIVERAKRILKLPSRAVPDQPPAPFRDKAQLSPMTFGEAESECLIGEYWRPRIAMRITGGLGV